MLNNLLKECKELTKEKENESNWLKIHNVFLSLINFLDTKESSLNSCQFISDLLIRSILSDRSRLSGSALDLLKHLSEKCNKELNFAIFLPSVIKLSGRSNKVFFNRAIEALKTICHLVDFNNIIKNINENIDSINKNIRFAVFTLIQELFFEYQDNFQSYIQRGLKDSAVEVRTICKSLVSNEKIVQKVEIQTEPKKSNLPLNTPRKISKIESKQEIKIKDLEKEVSNITNLIQQNSASSNFYEKLTMLKKEREYLNKKNDDLTPKKLDKYLDRFRQNKNGETFDIKKDSNEILLEKINSHRADLENTIVKDFTSISQKHQPTPLDEAGKSKPIEEYENSILTPSISADLNVKLIADNFSSKTPENSLNEKNDNLLASKALIYEKEQAFDDPNESKCREKEMDKSSTRVDETPNFFDIPESNIQGGKIQLEDQSLIIPDSLVILTPNAMKKNCSIKALSLNSEEIDVVRKHSIVEASNINDSINHHADRSLIHNLMSNKEMENEIKSDDNQSSNHKDYYLAEEYMSKDIESLSDSLILDDIVPNNCNFPEISNLSRSIANISIDPSKCDESNRKSDDCKDLIDNERENRVLVQNLSVTNEMCENIWALTSQISIAQSNQNDNQLDYITLSHQKASQEDLLLELYKEAVNQGSNPKSFHHQNEMMDIKEDNNCYNTLYDELESERMDLGTEIICDDLKLNHSLINENTLILKENVALEASLKSSQNKMEIDNFCPNKIEYHPHRLFSVNNFEEQSEESMDETKPVFIQEYEIKNGDKLEINRSTSFIEYKLSSGEGMAFVEEDTSVDSNFQE